MATSHPIRLSILLVVLPRRAVASTITSRRCRVEAAATRRLLFEALILARHAAQRTGWMVRVQGLRAGTTVLSSLGRRGLRRLLARRGRLLTVMMMARSAKGRDKLSAAGERCPLPCSAIRLVEVGRP